MSMSKFFKRLRTLIVGHIQFNTTALPATNAEGLLQWNATDETLDLGMSGGAITMQVGQELFVKAINKSGTAIPNGTAVYVSGRQGNRPKIVPAIGNDINKASVLGLTTQDIADGDEGFVTTFGYVRQIKTNYDGWSEGDRLWLSKTVAGELTNAEPAAPHYSPIVGSVGIVGAAGIGSILVQSIPSCSLRQLSDVNGTATTVSGQLLYWDQDNLRWDALTGVLATNTSGIRLAGTTTVHKDMNIELIGRQLYSVAGKVDYNFAENAITFESGGSLATENDLVRANLQINHEFKVGSNITFKPHIHWWQQVTSGTVLPVVFSMAWRIQRNAGTGAKTTAWTTITANAGTAKDVFNFTGQADGLYNQITAFDPIVVTCSLSDILQFKLTRTDMQIGDVDAVYIDLHGEVDSMGSDTEYSKA